MTSSIIFQCEVNEETKGKKMKNSKYSTNTKEKKNQNIDVAKLLYKEVFKLCTTHVPFPVVPSAYVFLKIHLQNKTFSTYCIHSAKKSSFETSFISLTNKFNSTEIYAQNTICKIGYCVSD